MRNASYRSSGKFFVPSNKTLIVLPIALPTSPGPCSNDCECTQLLCRCRPPPVEGHGPRDPLDRQTNAARLDNTSYYTIHGEHWHCELLFPSSSPLSRLCEHMSKSLYLCEECWWATSSNIHKHWIPFLGSMSASPETCIPHKCQQATAPDTVSIPFGWALKTSHRIHACEGQHSRRHWSGISHHGHQPEHPRVLLGGFRGEYRLQAKISANTSF